MENIFLTAAATFCGCAAVASLIPGFNSKVVPRIFWYLSALFMLADLGLMISYLAGSRFDYSYVFNHTDRSLSIIYRISALWSGQEGSFLLWAAVLALMGFPVLKAKGEKSGKVFGVYASISFCIFMMCLVSQPFSKLPATPVNGLGMATALQDPWMTVHPPLVFVAYSALGILAALTIGISKVKDTDTIRKIQKWTRISWVFLGLGIFTGSIWAYHALGWGGYWSWDPIENAALVPWLILCGYLHSKEKVSRVRCILPFAIACFGTFLTRSGILKDKSSHAYTEGNPIVSTIIIAFLLAALCWFIISKIRLTGKMKRRYCTSGIMEAIRDRKSLFSRIVYACSVLIALGTIAPLIFNLNTPVEYYTAVVVIFALAYSFLLMAQDWEALKRRNLLMMAISTFIVIGIAVATGSMNLGWIILLWICLLPLSLWIACRFKTQSPRYYLLHMGMVLLIFGAITSSGLGKESLAIVRPTGRTVDIEGSSVQYGDFAKSDVLIVSKLTGDVIVKCADAFMMPDGSIAIPYITKPFILLFWMGGFMIILSPCIMVFARRITNAFQIKKELSHGPKPQPTIPWHNVSTRKIE